MSDRGKQELNCDDGTWAAAAISFFIGGRESDADNTEMRDSNGNVNITIFSNSCAISKLY